MVNFGIVVHAVVTEDSLRVVFAVSPFFDTAPDASIFAVGIVAAVITASVPHTAACYFRSSCRQLYCSCCSS